MGLRVLVCGSRYYCNYSKVLACLSGMEVSLVIAGGANGADSLAIRAARECGFAYAEYRANWKLYGKMAGPVRNQQMIDSGKPDFVIAFHEDLGKSKGTKDMLLRVQKAGIPFQVFS